MIEEVSFDSEYIIEKMDNRVGRRGLGDIISTFRSVLLILASLVLFSAVPKVDGAVLPTDFLGTACNETSDCIPIHSKAICEPPANSNDTQCACPSDEHYHVQDSGCYYSQENVLGICDSVSATEPTVCAPVNSECQSDGSGLKRCSCKLGYVHLKDQNKCGKIITATTDSNCNTCLANEGTCFDLEGDGTNDGCLCPASRSGASCATIHVTVMCDVQHFKMRVCYKPHSNVDLANGWSMSTYQHGSQPECVGVPSDNECGAGQWSINLSLVDSDLATCGTTKAQGQQFKTKYISMVRVAQASGQSSDIVFNTFCSYDTLAKLGSNGVFLSGIPGNERGEHMAADITLQVLTENSRLVPEGVALRTSDKIHLRIVLTDDGTYSGVKVLRCAVSSSSLTPPSDPHAVIKTLISDGCPASQQVYIDDTNNFKRENGAPNILRAGPMQVFSLSKGDALFLHCTLVLCLTGSEDNCMPETCPTVRRKRSASDSYTVDISKRIDVYDPEYVKGKTIIDTWAFALLVAFLVMIIVLLAILVLILYLRQRTKNDQKPSDVPPPYAISLPRINRTHLRI